MNTKLLPLAAVLAIALAPAAHAQRASLADRVAALEQQANNNQGNVELLNQINALKDSVRDLQGQIEQLQQDNEQLKSTSKSQYLDIDSRQAVRLAYAFARSVIAQTGELGQLNSDGSPVMISPVNDPITDASGNVVEKRDTAVQS